MSILVKNYDTSKDHKKIIHVIKELANSARRRFHDSPIKQRDKIVHNTNNS